MLSALSYWFILACRQGLVYDGRKEGKNTAEKDEFARPARDMAALPSNASLVQVHMLKTLMQYPCKI